MHPETTKIFTRTSKEWESDIFLEKINSKDYLYKHYSYELFKTCWKQKLQPEEYISLYSQLHNILNKEGPIYIHLGENYLLQTPEDRVINKKIPIPSLRQKSLKISGFNLHILPLPEDYWLASRIDTKEKEIITNPPYISGKTLGLWLWRSTEQRYKKSARNYTDPNDEPIDQLISLIKSKIINKINQKYWRFGLIFDPKTIASMNLKVMSYTHNSLDIICTDLWATIWGLVEKNRTVIPHLAKKLKSNNKK